jgi:predicted kinase
MAEEKKQNFMVCIGGWPGSGKTTIASLLHATLPKTIHLDSDAMRKKMLQTPLHQKLPEAAYHAAQTKKLIDYTAQAVIEFLKRGQNIILSATFYDEASRLHQVKIASEAGVAFFGFILDAPYDLLARRIEKRLADHDPLNPSDADIKVLERLFTGEFKQLEKPWKIIKADRETHDILAEIKAVLAI